MPTSACSSNSVRCSDDTSGAHGIGQRVTAEIAELLRNGVRPWVASWDSAKALSLPLRASSIAYRGVNVLVLWAAARAHGYRARHWLTFKQALALGGAVRRGERGQRVVFYSGGQNAKDEDADAPATPRRAVLRSFVAFNAEQINGLPVHFYAPPIALPTDDECALAERFARIPASIENGGARACYNPMRDTIYMPPRAAFRSVQLYYATLAHECAHWTGHSTRLDRGIKPGMSQTAYAREELIAELAAAFLGAELGLPADHLEDHASYLDAWLKLLDHEPGALLSAAAKAQTAADHLRGFLFSGEPTA